MLDSVDLLNKKPAAFSLTLEFFSHTQIMCPVLSGLTWFR